MSTQGVNGCRLAPATREAGSRLWRQAVWLSGGAWWGNDRPTRSDPGLGAWHAARGQGQDSNTMHEKSGNGHVCFSKTQHADLLRLSSP